MGVKKKILLCKFVPKKKINKDVLRWLKDRILLFNGM